MSTSHPSPTTQPETNAATPTTRAQYVQLIFIIVALSAFGPLSIDMYLPGLPSLSQDLGATASEAQLTLTACLLGLAAGQIVAGPFSDAAGRRRPLVIGLAACTVASLLCAFAPSIPVFVALRVV